MKRKAEEDWKRGVKTLCWICQTPIDMTLNGRDKMAFTVDHLVPLALDGDILGEMLPAHRSCNSKRGSYVGHEQMRRNNDLKGRTRQW